VICVSGLREIAERLESYPRIAVRVLRSRPQERRANINVNPFNMLDSDLNEAVCHRLEAEQKKNFWLNRFDKNIVGWL